MRLFYKKKTALHKYKKKMTSIRKSYLPIHTYILYSCTICHTRAHEISILKFTRRPLFMFIVFVLYFKFYVRVCAFTFGDVFALIKLSELFFHIATICVCVLLPIVVRLSRL